jgi:hypothetical protein
MIMIIKAKYFFGFLHVVSRGNDSVVVISPEKELAKIAKSFLK